MRRKIQLNKTIRIKYKNLENIDNYYYYYYLVGAFETNQTNNNKKKSDNNNNNIKQTNKLKKQTLTNLFTLHYIITIIFY